MTIVTFQFHHKETDFDTNQLKTDRLPKRTSEYSEESGTVIESEGIQPEVLSNPTPVAPEPQTATPQAEQRVTVDCPRGVVYDPYPGRCRRYVDKNGDGYCDLSIPKDA